MLFLTEDNPFVGTKQELEVMEIVYDA
jgi:ferredoxin-thioredoxin reductase catalytic chain